jgi:hypothetical protein
MEGYGKEVKGANWGGMIAEEIGNIRNSTLASSGPSRQSERAACHLQSWIAERTQKTF